MKIISDAELEVMNVIWKKEKITSKEIIKELSTKNWHTTTIRTLINRLFTKRAIGICKKDGKIYTYTPLIQKRDYQNYMYKRFINQFFNGSTLEFLEFLKESNEIYYEKTKKQVLHL